MLIYYLLVALLDSGILNRKASLDLLDDLDFGFLNVGELSTSPSHGGEPFPEPSTHHESLDDWDDLKFETAFADISTKPCLPGRKCYLVFDFNRKKSSWSYS